MALGHYLWKNSDGSTVDIDVDALPKTDKPPNVLLPNVHIDLDAFGNGSGRLFRCEVPNFRIDPATDRLYHSTNYTESEDAWVGRA